jgi:hypothetical protein
MLPYVLEDIELAEMLFTALDNRTIREVMRDMLQKIYLVDEPGTLPPILASAHARSTTIALPL